MPGKYDRVPREDRERVANIWNDMSVEAVHNHEPPHVVQVLREEYLRELARLELDERPARKAAKLAGRPVYF